MRTTATKWDKILDLIFNTPSHLAILRVLSSKPQGISGRACAKEAGINHQSCYVALNKLYEFGVVNKVGFNRTMLYSLNKNSEIVKNAIVPLLIVEKEITSNFIKSIKNLLTNKVLSVTIFGSQVAQKATVLSDFDLCLIVDDKETQKKMSEALNSKLIEYKSKYSYKLAPIIFTKQELVRLGKKDNPLIKNIVKGGQLIYGRNIKDLL